MVTEADEFEALRPRMFALAYRLLGEASEAEDVVQDAYLRWERSGSVVIPEAWLTKVVTNLCLNRLTSARARRERYVGPWLPEPVFTGAGPAEIAEQRDALSMGFMVVLERLTPPERAAFVLREAFGHAHREIAEILDIDEAHARQLCHRARGRVSEPHRRFTATREQNRRIVERFLAAVLEGDVAGLERMLADDVVSWSDGGGKATAARRPVIGTAEVLRLWVGVGAHPRVERAEITIREVNGDPAVVVVEDGTLTAVITPEIIDGRITAIRTVMNPDKLLFAARQLM